MRIPKAQQLTRDQHSFLVGRINEANSTARYRNETKKPPHVRDAERTVAAWERQQERKKAARSTKLQAAKQGALQKLLFCTADEAQAATDAFLVFAESV